VHGIKNGDGIVEPRPLSGVVKALVEINIIPDPVVQMAEADEASWMSLAALNKSIWENTDTQWTTAVINVASRSTSSVRETGSVAEQFGQGFLTGITFGAKPLDRTWQKTTITGQDVADWINNGTITSATLHSNQDTFSPVSI
jgi:hypothetical protein